LTPSVPRLFAVEGSTGNLLVTFCLVSLLFLLWGFCNGLIDVMDKHFQEELHLSLSQSAWVQFAHYMGYFLMSLPAGVLSRKLGYKGGIVTGLLIVAASGFWFLAATQIAMFWAFLLGVCGIASGLTFLETVANPYATVLGDKRYAAFRINLAQSCNGIGWVLGPITGSLYFYSVDAHGHSNGSQSLYIPYVGVGVVVVVLAVVFSVAYVPDIQVEDEYSADVVNVVTSKPLWSRPHFVMGVAAQFLYVAAQAGIFSFFINYMTSQVPPIPDSWNAFMGHLAHNAGHFQAWLTGWIYKGAGGALAISNKGAANLASIAFVCFLIGRIAGTWLMKKRAAHKNLALYGAMSVVMSLLVFCKLGWLSVLCVFLLYFFMSIMFPTIFALGIHGLGAQTKRGSAYLVMAILGGAILPKMMGSIADRWDISRSFIVPLVCFAFIVFYALAWPKLSRTGGHEPAHRER
jgi:MFS transporter, FHS family, L-fucose permease